MHTNDKGAGVVQSFYERLPYPPPLTDLERHVELYRNPERRRTRFHLVFPTARLRAGRQILVPGCGTSQAAVIALREPDAQVTGIDITSHAAAEGASCTPMRRIALVLVAVLMCWASMAAAQSVRVVSSFPLVDQVMDGSETAFAIRFDRPVDHARSRLTLVTPQGDRPLQPRLETEPNTLFSPVGRLPPGLYELRWEAVEMGGAVSRGTIPFRVANPL